MSTDQFRCVCSELKRFEGADSLLQARMNIEQLLETQRNDRKKLIANFEQRLQLVRGFRAESN